MHHAQLPEGRATEALERGLLNLHELVDHTLVTAAEASGVHLRRETIRLSELITDIEKVAAADADHKGVQLELKLEGNDAIQGDARLLRSAISNLVRNAIKFSKEGGKVEVRLKESAGRVTIEIEDECGGLAPGMVERAFAPFVRTNPSKGGFGLGLAIAKQAVDAHGGSIRIQNVLNKGCIFVLELPSS